MFTASATQHDVDPFAKHPDANQRQATIDAFREGIAVVVALCFAGALLAARRLHDEPQRAEPRWRAPPAQDATP